MVVTAVQVDMKIDGRTLTCEILEAMRFMALDRMAEGESPAATSALFGIHRSLGVQGAGESARPGQAGSAVVAGARAAPDVDRCPGATGISLGERQESAAGTVSTSGCGPVRSWES